MATQAAQQEPNLHAVESDGGAEMTLIEHLKELRNRVIVCAIAVMLGIALCAIFWQDIVGWLIAPARADHPGFALNVFSPTETIFLAFKIAMYGGLILASPVVIYEIMMFVVPGLTPQEKKLILPGLLGTLAFLLGGMAFAYWIILPASLSFLLDFGGDEFNNVIRAKEYIDFATRIIFWVGLAFELPMIIALLAKLKVVSARQLIGFWRYMIILVFIIAAIVTPTPDPITQTFVAGPLLVLYVVGVLFAWALRRGEKRPPEAEAA